MTWKAPTDELVNGTPVDQYLTELERRVAALERAARRRGPRWTVHPHAAHRHLDQWREWLARYGLPAPENIPANTDIVFDSDTKTLTATRCVTDDNGRGIVGTNNEMLKEQVTVVVDGFLHDFPPGCEIEVD